MNTTQKLVKTKVDPKKITDADINRAVLHDNYGYYEYGVLAGATPLGLSVHFGMNQKPIVMRGNDLYFVEFKKE